MTWPNTANPERFDEAMEWFESRVPIPANRLADLTEAQRKQAFVISGVNQMSVVTTVLDEMAKAVESGEPIQDFRKRVKAKVRGDWTKASSARLDTIFITNTQVAYNAGRYAQMTDPDVMKLRPFWVFDAVLDSRTSHICNTLQGTTLPADDPAWSGIYPPMHHRCRSSVRTLSRRAGNRRGVTEDVPSPKIPEGFGKVPAPRSGFRPDAKDYPADIFSIYQRKQRTMRRRAAQG